MNDNARPNAAASVAIIVLTAALVVFIVLFAVERSKRLTPIAENSAALPLPENQIILRYRGGEIRARDLANDVTDRVMEAAEGLYKKAAQKVLLDRLLAAEAKKQNKPSADALLEPIGATIPVTEDDITAFMKTNDLENGFKDPDTDKVRPVSRTEIREHLIKKNQTLERQDYIEKLLAQADISWTLDQLRHPIPPIGPDEPVLGDRHAKVVLFTYSDFQCPFCARENEVLDQVHKTYRDKVAIVFRHLPLDNHPEARPAAIASICAQRQGKFWQFHDRLFQHQDELTEASYLKWAKELDLDEAKFQVCLGSDDVRKTLEASAATSAQAGINFVPSVFVATNAGQHEMHGTKSLSDFREAIDPALR